MEIFAILIILIPTIIYFINEHNVLTAKKEK